MFHTPAHLNTTSPAHQFAFGEFPGKKAYCTSCGGAGDTGHDEVGLPYTCYACYGTGLISKAAAEEEASLERYHWYTSDLDRVARRKALGVPDGYSYYIDEVDGKVVLIPPRSTVPAVVNYDDDIPF